MTLLDLFLLFGKGEFIYADTASVPPEYKACLCSSCEDHIDDNHHTGYSFDQEDGEVIAKGLSTETLSRRKIMIMAYNKPLDFSTRLMESSFGKIIYTKTAY